MKYLSIVLLALVLPVMGCKKKADAEKQAVKEQAVPTPTPTPSPTPTPTPAPQANKDAHVVVLCYHRFEGGKLGALSIDPQLFEQQLQQIKDSGAEVISMKDFLAWKRGEKEIPQKSVIITIDDGYESGYSVAWPMLKKFDFPFTMYVYTKFINSGGKSISWAQLEEMRDAGVDIGSHTFTHSDLVAGKKGKNDEAYKAFLKEELAGSKNTLEEKLGIQVLSVAFPYGRHNELVRDMAMEAGYEAAFTVYGQRIGYNAPNKMLGRYAIEQAKPDIFKTAVSFTGSIAAGVAESTVGQHAAASMMTQPADGQKTGDPRPLIKANLATFGEIDPQSVEMRVSGLGLVPVQYDPATRTASYQVTGDLQPKSYTVILSAKKGGKKVEARWSFEFDASAPVSSAVEPATELPPRR